VQVFDGNGKYQTQWNNLMVAARVVPAVNPSATPAMLPPPDMGAQQAMDPSLVLSTTTPPHPAFSASLAYV
jgi:hypothetical protein